MEKINDIDLSNWKNYSDISTDSLWIIDKRDSSGNHKGDYHGNFVPQIPNQLLKRYTKKGDWVLDAFLGSGTTLIECQKLGRNGIGIDIDPEILSVAKERTLTEKGTSNFEFINGDSSNYNLAPILEKNRYIGIVIGDIYKNSEWIPLNTYINLLMLEKGYKLKSIVVKNIGETQGKQNQQAIWRYRALAGGFYIFKHEYILIFKKVTN